MASAKESAIRTVRVTYLSRTRRPRHAAALALVGWCLMTPPLGLTAATTAANRQKVENRAVMTSTPPTKTSDTSEEKERHDRREEALEQRLVILTAILALIEVITLFIFVGTMIANIRAANAAKTAAQATEASTKIAGQTMAIGQRGYLYLSGIRFDRIEPSTVWITYPIYNAGQTPATFTGEFVRANVYPVGIYPDPIKRGEVATTKKSVVVPPAQIDADFAGIKGHYSLELTDDEIEGIEKGKSQIVFHGFVRYTDIFGQWHDTGFGVAFAASLSTGSHQMAWIQKLGFNWFD
jgi:hypothetical protein